MMPIRFEANATSAVGPVPLNEPAKTRLAMNTGRNATKLARPYRNGSDVIERKDSCGTKYASSKAATSTVYSGTDGRNGKRALKNTASMTLHKIAKNTSEFTSQVEPNSSENVTRLRVSSSMNAAPRKNMWPLKPRLAVFGARKKISPSAMMATIASASGNGDGTP